MNSNRKITELINENYVYGYILYYLGIQFYDYSEKTLEEACREQGLNVKSVIKSLEAVHLQSDEENLTLRKYPIDLIIEYLIHAHYNFVKKRLPYLARLIENLPPEPKYDVVINDLKFIFPIFVEDFIQHIYQEEDTFFYYIRLLNKANAKGCNFSELYYQMEKNSVQSFAVEHDLHDDEMEGLKHITENFVVEEDAHLLFKVTLAELQNFQKELMIHAKIENEILFPKALELEKKVKGNLRTKVRQN